MRPTNQKKCLLWLWIAALVAVIFFGVRYFAQDSAAKRQQTLVSLRGRTQQAQNDTAQLAAEFTDARLTRAREQANRVMAGLKTREEWDATAARWGSLGFRITTTADDMAATKPAATAAEPARAGAEAGVSLRPVRVKIDFGGMNLAGPSDMRTSLVSVLESMDATYSPPVAFLLRMDSVMRPDGIPFRTRVAEGSAEYKLILRSR